MQLMSIRKVLIRHLLLAAAQAACASALSAAGVAASELHALELVGGDDGAVERDRDHDAERAAHRGEGRARRRRRGFLTAKIAQFYWTNHARPAPNHCKACARSLGVHRVLRGRVERLVLPRMSRRRRAQLLEALSIFTQPRVRDAKIALVVHSDAADARLLGRA